MAEIKPGMDWRLAVQEAMRRAAQSEGRTRIDTAEPAFDYRWEHVTAVVTLAVRLADLVGADREIVEAAAWLHDIAKAEGENHPELGAEHARRLLPQTDFPPEKIEGVAEVISQHKGLWLDKPLANLEAMVLWDADKLSKVGVTAAFHWTGMELSNGEPITTVELIEKGRNAEWQARTVNSMHTEPARRAARRRLHAFREIWNRLEAELRGDDLL